MTWNGIRYVWAGSYQTAADASTKNFAPLRWHQSSNSAFKVGHKSLAQDGPRVCHVSSVGKYAERTPMGSSRTNTPPGPVQTSSSFHLGSNVNTAMAG